MKKYTKLLIFYSFFSILALFSAFSQPNYCFRVYLANKANSAYSVDKPEEFLSQRAIDKRTRFNIEITEEDLPVNQSYISQIAATDTAVRVWSVSKWTNTLTIICSDTLALGDIRAMDFVTGIRPIGVYYQNEAPIDKNVEMPQRAPEPDTSLYGFAFPQIALHNGHYLHNEGFRGEGMLIAILDGGWSKFDTFYNYLYVNNRIKGTYNLTPFSENLYENGFHGTACTSIIATNIPYQIVGTAPEADYLLIRSEEPGFELMIEEDLWARGAEIADSIGADVISSSLGYTRFDDDTTITYSSCDGVTSIASIAATKAAHKGIIVCVAAGNDGAKDWHKISRPSDAKDILCVGAVNKDSAYAWFSSCGPSFDDRVKPDIASCGWGTFVISQEGLILPGNGTSFATPVISGLSACLWQALPEYNSLEIMQFIRESGHQFLNPDTLLGYGIPDFYKAWLEHTKDKIKETKNTNHFSVYPNPANNQIFLSNPEGKEVRYELFDIMGKMVKQECKFSNNSTQSIEIQNFTKGVYLLRIIEENGNSELVRVVKN
ncbi:MAG: S8 family peptidase [Bacteroidales bacterium]|nr:S8 family peptidase [Bacteroidales bacterium]